VLRRPAAAAVAAAIALAAPVVCSSAADAARQSPTSRRLYIFDCGTLKERDGVAYGLTRDQLPPRDLSNPCALVVHPRGTLLWETGLHESVNSAPPAAGARPGRPRAGDRVDRTLSSQLRQAGFGPADITHVAISHAHWDHTGNLRDYVTSTWLVQRAERDAIFGTAPLPNQDDFAGLERMSTRTIEGDHDVFGDGTVMLHLTPGHTAGHQVLFVRLPRTGPVILSGDLYHFGEELTVAPAAAGRNAAQIAASKARIQELIAKTGAQLWIQHDIHHYGKLRKAPEFYD
jgi:glyoxylase-like metal-dependent hydrolase (beta-lactamase superfamily II)